MVAGTEHSRLARPNQEHVQEDSQFVVAPGEQHAGVGVDLGSYQREPRGLGACPLVFTSKPHGIPTP